MDDILLYCVSALFICCALTFVALGRIKSDIIPENYEFKFDPFWPVSGMFFIGGIGICFFLPDTFDHIKNYSYADVIVPILLSVVIYFGYLLDVLWLANGLTLGAAFIMAYLQPQSFQLFPEHLTLWQDRIVVTVLLFIVSKGLGALNGMAGVASSQFITVTATAFVLVYLGGLPLFLGGLAMAYCGVMLAFLFFSVPKEKLIISDGGFSAIGFILGCFMLFCSVECAEVSMFVACSYLFTEVMFVLYQRFFHRQTDGHCFMNTFYFQLLNKGYSETFLLRGIIKILLIDFALSIIQTAARERLAFPVFAVALNLWFLSILSGDTKPQELLSISKWGKNIVKEALAKNKENKKHQK